MPLVKENKKIAIIFFSLEAKLQARFKIFTKSNSLVNKNINAALIFETKKTIESTGIPIFHYHQDNQTGASFGERLANAYQEVFDLGYDSVISVGNDSPEINQLDWTNISEKLNNGENVIGPNLRGGTYLIGINKHQFNKSSFASLPWQSAKLFVALVQYCKSFSAPSILEKLRDLNTFHDLRQFVNEASSLRKLSQLVKSILSTKILKYLSKNINFQILIALPGAPFRAPPKYTA